MTLWAARTPGLSPRVSQPPTRTPRSFPSLSIPSLPVHSWLPHPRCRIQDLPLINITQSQCLVSIPALTGMGTAQRHQGQSIAFAMDSVSLFLVASARDSVALGNSWPTKLSRKLCNFFSSSLDKIMASALSRSVIHCHLPKIKLKHITLF